MAAASVTMSDGLRHIWERAQFAPARDYRLKDFSNKQQKHPTVSAKGTGGKLLCIFLCITSRKSIYNTKEGPGGHFARLLL